MRLVRTSGMEPVTLNLETAYSVPPNPKRHFVRPSIISAWHEVDEPAYSRTLARMEDDMASAQILGLAVATIDGGPHIQPFQPGGK